MGKVLIVIDMQNDFVTGTLGNKERVCGPRGSDNFYQGYPWGELSGHAGGEKVTSEALHQWNGRLADCAWAGSGKLRIYRQADLWLA